MDSLSGILANENCPIQNLFLDWNPIYSDDFRGGYPDDQADAYHPGPEESSVWAKLVQDAKKVQVLFIRHCDLTDRDLKQIGSSLKADAGAQQRQIKVLDLSFNKFTGEGVAEEVSAILETNRSLEYLGVAKSGLEAKHVLPMLQHFGKVLFPAD